MKRKASGRTGDNILDRKSLEMINISRRNIGIVVFISNHIFFSPNQNVFQKGIEFAGRSEFLNVHEKGKRINKSNDNKNVKIYVSFPTNGSTKNCVLPTAISI